MICPPKNGYVRVARSASVQPTAILGATYRPTLSGSVVRAYETELCNNVHVGNYVVIGAGSRIQEGVIIDDFVKIECNVDIGPRSLINYRAHIGNEVSIGADSIVGGFITERTKIGARCRVFGNIVHKHNDLRNSWDDDTAREDSAVLQSDIFLGFGAQIIGSVRIGSFVYIAAGAIITTDIPSNNFAYGLNQIKPIAETNIKFMENTR